MQSPQPAAAADAAMGCSSKRKVAVNIEAPHLCLKRCILGLISLSAIYSGTDSDSIKSDVICVSVSWVPDLARSWSVSDYYSRLGLCCS